MLRKVPKNMWPTFQGWFCQDGKCLCNKKPWCGKGTEGYIHVHKWVTPSESGEIERKRQQQEEALRHSNG